MTARQTIAGSVDPSWPDLRSWRDHWLDRISADVDRAGLPDTALDMAHSWLSITNHAADRNDGDLFAFAVGQLHLLLEKESHG